VALSDEQPAGQQPVYVWRIYRHGRSGQPFEQGRGTPAEIGGMVQRILADGHYLKMALAGIEIRVDKMPTSRIVAEPVEAPAARAFRAAWKRGGVA
jgi:hypothetical protein